MSPTYTFIGAYPRVLVGLSEGVNAHLSAPNGASPGYGLTIVAEPGDTLETDEPYVHSELEEVTPEASDARGLSPEDEAVPATDPAPDAMTAEGAPAPAEPTA